MIWLLKKLIFGHVHKWETVGRSRWTCETDTGAVVEYGPRYVCRCEICGEYRKFDL